MRESLTKSAARNIFYGGSLFFFVIFVGLTIYSRHYILTKSTDQAHLTDLVERGKRVWERNACFDCHTIYGEGGVSPRKSATCSSVGAAKRTRKEPHRTSPPLRPAHRHGTRSPSPAHVEGRRSQAGVHRKFTGPLEQIPTYTSSSRASTMST